MPIKKQDINKALETITAPGEGKSLVENNNLTNVVIFGDEVVVDITIANPTLQAKKKVEVEVIKAIHTHVDQKINVKVNVKSVPKPKEETSNVIRGKAIPNIQNIIAIASGKGGV